MVSESAKTKDEHLQVVAEHYQKTFELADGLRRDRNKFFIFLVAVLAGAALLFGFGKTMVLKLLAVWISKNIGLLEVNANSIPGMSQKDVTDWISNANFDLLLTLMLAVVFYLMMNLYHHTETVSRLYIYLGKLEIEIRLKLESNSQ